MEYEFSEQFNAMETAISSHKIGHSSPMKIAYVASISVGEKRKTEEQDFGGFVSANNRVRAKKRKMGWGGEGMKRLQTNP